MTHTKQAEMLTGRSPTPISVHLQDILFAVPHSQLLSEGGVAAYRHMNRRWEFAPLCSTLFASYRVRVRYLYLNPFTRRSKCMMNVSFSSIAAAAVELAACYS